MNTQDYDDETMEKAKEITESYIRSNYENIEIIEFSGVEESPMGGMVVKGEVNNGEGSFSVSMDEETFNIAGIGSKNFPNLKEECKEQECDF